MRRSYTIRESLNYVELHTKVGIAYNAIQVTTGGKFDWYRSGFRIKSRDGERKMFEGLDEALVGLATKRFVDEQLRHRDDFKTAFEEIENAGGEVDTTRQGELAFFLKTVDEICRSRPDVFGSKDALIHMFMKAQVTGNILPLARLFDRAYSHGAFRKLSRF